MPASAGSSWQRPEKHKHGVLHLGQHHPRQPEDCHQRDIPAFNFEKYAHRYLREYQYRFNRRFDLAGMLSRMITAAAQTGKRSEGWLRFAEDQC